MVNRKFQLVISYHLTLYVRDPLCADETGLAATVVPEKKEVAIQPHTGEVETGAVDEEDLLEHRIGH